MYRVENSCSLVPSCVIKNDKIAPAVKNNNAIKETFLKCLLTRNGYNVSQFMKCQIKVLQTILRFDYIET
jgi:hypothetical protein